MAVGNLLVLFFSNHILVIARFLYTCSQIQSITWIVMHIMGPQNKHDGINITFAYLFHIDCIMSSGESFSPKIGF